MADDHKKLEFFDDIRDKLILILGGIISLATVIPAFLNKTSEIFGLEEIQTGYRIFVAIYFIFPVWFYLIYCSINDYVGFLQLLPEKWSGYIRENKRRKVLIESLLLLIVLFYLVSPGELSDIGSSVILYGLSLACFISFFIQYRRSGVGGQALNEFLIIGLVIVVVFGAFFINIHSAKSGKSPFDFSEDEQQKAFDGYNFKNVYKKKVVNVLDSARKIAYKYSLEAKVIHPWTVAPALKPDADLEMCFSELYQFIYKIDRSDTLDPAPLKKNASVVKTAISHILYRDNKLVSVKDSQYYRVYQIQTLFDHLHDYSLVIQSEKTLRASLRWSKLLRNLQYKSMVWFHFLILLSLCLWFKMQFQRNSIPNPNYKLVPKLEDNLAQVKSLIFFLFVLIVPWFRQIDEKDVELEKPFLNLSLGRLVNGELGQGDQINNIQNSNTNPVNISHNGDMIFEQPVAAGPDTSKGVYPLLLKIKTSQDKQADRTINRSGDRDSYYDQNEK